MLNPAVTPAFRRRLFAWLFASCAISVFSYAQPAPDITGEDVACQGDAFFYATAFTPGHTWAWTVSPGGLILQNLGNFIEVIWTGPQNSTQSVSVTETDVNGLTGTDDLTVFIKKTVLVCENTVNLSLDSDGVSEVLPSMLLDGNYNTYEGFIVSVTTPAGAFLGNTVDCSHIGLTLTGKVMDPCTGNACWSLIHVEDKNGPHFDCLTVPVEIPCDADIETILAPVVVDNCDTDIEVNLVGYQVDNSDICDGVWITRNWTAEDNYGNQSYCSEVLHISPNGPVDFPKDTAWTCVQYDLYPNITNASAFTDSLHTTGSGIPSGVGGPYCQYNYLHEDDTLSVCGNSFKILRTWTVVNWCTGEIILEDFEGDDNEQIIKVMDYNKPTMTVPPFVLNANVPGDGIYVYTCKSTGLMPAPVVFDSCNAVTVQIFTQVGEAIYVNGVNGNDGGNVPSPGLGIGFHPIIYKATDACGNQTELTLIIQVTDLTAPTPVCDEYTDVNLNAQGFAEVFATTFDDGSHDNCCIDYFLVKRMSEPDWAFATSIDFDCNDGDSAMVVLRVVDCFGNYNDCMVNVIINDKIAPICIAPQQKIIPCTDLPPDVTQDWLDGFGAAVTFDNCGATITELPFLENVNACGDGHVIRYFQAVDNSGNTATCEQHIYVTPASDWLIKFPADWYGECNDSVDAPDLEINNFGCDLLAVSHEDQYFALTIGDSACFKIIRTWKVLNWCNYIGGSTPIKVPHHPLGVWIDEEDYNNFGYYEYQQVIKVYDDTPPVLSYPFANEFCSLDANCAEGNAFVPIQIDGVCSAVFNVVYHLDLNSDLTYDLNGTGFFDGVLPLGNHRILYVVEDGCGNSSQIVVDFIVKDCKKPTAICENGLIVEIMQTGMVPVCADALDYGSYDNCPGELTFSFSEDVDDSCRIFTCLDILQTIPVNIWVTDAAGNQDYCSTFLIVQDNMFTCANGAPVNGLVATAESEPVEGVDVTLNSNNGDLDFTTNADGLYLFGGLTIGQDYSVTPAKDDGPLNGVTTFDLVLISKHILGATLLDSPYKIIAADANNSGSVTTFDLVEIRKLILMINDDFPNNTSWRFVDEDFVFPNPANPWQTVFPEVININNLPAAVTGADFVAVKIGDVNGSASANNLTGSTGNRSSENLDFQLENLPLETGMVVPVTLRAKDFISVYGFQFTIDFNTDLLDFQSVTATSLTSAENFGTSLTSVGAVTVSWDEISPVTLANGEAVITLNFLVKNACQLSEAIAISSRFTIAEAYIGEQMEIRGIGLEVIEGSVSATTDESSTDFELFQNVPNPFSRKTAIGFRLPTASDAKLTIFDASGKVLKTAAGHYPAGFSEVLLDRDELPAEGMLFYRLEAADRTATRSMTLVKK